MQKALRKMVFVSAFYTSILVYLDENIGTKMSSSLDFTVLKSRYYWLSEAG